MCAAYSSALVAVPTDARLLSLSGSVSLLYSVSLAAVLYVVLCHLKIATSSLVTTNFPSILAVLIVTALVILATLPPTALFRSVFMQLGQVISAIVVPTASMFVAVCADIQHLNIIANLDRYSYSSGIALSLTNQNMCKIKIMMCVGCLYTNTKEYGCEDRTKDGNESKYATMISRDWMSAQTATNIDAVGTTIALMTCPSCMKTEPKRAVGGNVAKITRAVTIKTANILGKFVVIKDDVAIFKWHKTTYKTAASDTEYESETDPDNDNNRASVATATDVDE